MDEGETNFFQQGIQFLVPQPCFDEFFVKLNFFDETCLKIVISKCLGFGIILGAVLVKLPQIIKILAAKSGEGINIPSVIIELMALSASACYGFAKGFPFSSYGDAFFLILQTAIIAFLVLVFSGKSFQGVIFIGVYSSTLAYLLSPAAPLGFISLLQRCSIGIIIVSKLLQAFANFRNGSTGQLSAVTCLLLFAGAFARIFTSIQETGDNSVILSYVIATVLNGLIFGQVLYYWNVAKTEKIE